MLKRTVLYDNHIKLNASMVDFGGWEMPVNYVPGIVEEHIYTRKKAGIFDVSHMGRFIIKGSEALEFLQYVLTNNARALDMKRAQYTIIPDENGGAIDDAYLYRFFEGEYLLVVNASNTRKDWEHLNNEIIKFDAVITDKTSDLAMISMQGPEAEDILRRLTGIPILTEPIRNALNSFELGGKQILIARTGYTGEPIGFEIFLEASEAPGIWERLLELGAMAIGLGARDTLRLEAGLPLYGHELGTDIDGNEIQIFSCPLAKFAVSLEDCKGEFIGKKALIKQFEAYKKIAKKEYSSVSDLPRITKPITLIDKGIARAGCKVFKNGIEVGYITSGTMVPYLKIEGQGPDGIITGEKGMRSIGLALLDSEVQINDQVEVDVRGRKLKAVIQQAHLIKNKPPFARPVIYALDLN